MSKLFSEACCLVSATLFFTSDLAIGSTISTDTKKCLINIAKRPFKSAARLCRELEPSKRIAWKIESEILEKEMGRGRSIAKYKGDQALW